MYLIISYSCATISSQQSKIMNPHFIIGPLKNPSIIVHLKSPLIIGPHKPHGHILNFTKQLTSNHAQQDVLKR